MKTLIERDELIFKLISEEQERQETGIELIASENFVSKQVMEAAGSALTNKYAEGLPGKRYYGGCEVVDEIEKIAIARAKVHLTENISLSDYEDDDDDSGFCCPCCLPR